MDETGMQGSFVLNRCFLLASIHMCVKLIPDALVRQAYNLVVNIPL